MGLEECVAEGKFGRDRRVEQQIRAWRDDLINLTRRNGLLYYKPTRSSTFEITAPDVLEVVRRLQRNSKTGWGFYEPPEPAEDDDPSPQLERKQRKVDELLTQKKDAAALRSTLRGLDRRANQEYLDKGLWVLYLGAGMLHWEDPDRRETVRSPLVLYPVVIQRESPRSPYRLLLGEDDAVANPSLAVKLDTDFGIDLPDIEESDDLASYFDVVRLLVKAQRWRVEADGVVRTFSFHKEVMYRDLEMNEKAIAVHPVARSLALGPDADEDLAFDPVGEHDLDETCPPEEATAILDADATQRRCLAAASLGHSFVMDGPPGTGKSQTIANLIASSIEQGKTVLFVSEKAAALDVVSSRLEALGLGEYLLELHSQKATRKQFAYTMAEALGRRPVPPTKLSSTSLRLLKERRTKLSEYARAMNEIRYPLDRDLHNVLGRISQLDEAPEAPVPTGIGASLSDDELQDILAVAGRWARAWGPVERQDDFLWAGTTLAGSDIAEVQRTTRDLNRSIEDLEKLREASQWIADELGLDTPVTSLDSDTELALLELCDRRRDVLESWLTDPDLDDVRARAMEVRQLCMSHHEHVGRVQDIVGESWTDLDSSTLHRFEAACEAIARTPDVQRLRDDAEIESVEAIVGALERSLAICADIIESGDELTEALVGESAPSSVSDIQVLASVAAMIGSGPDPDESWLDAVALGRARESAEVLQQATDDYRDRKEALESVFSEDVLDLDLQGLSVRYEETHRGFRKLARAYREDKRTVAEVSRTEKATKDVTARLQEALDWQKSRDNWRDAEDSHASVIGKHYYSGEKTDFEAISAALSRADSILTASGGRVSQSGLQDNFTVQHSPNAQLKALGQSTATSIGLLTEELAVAGIPTHLFETARDLRQWLLSLKERVAVVAEILEHVDSVAGRHLTLRLAGDALRERQSVHEILAVLDAGIEADEALLGPEYRRLDTDWPSLEESIDWAQDVRTVFGDPLGSDIAGALMSTGIRSDALRPRLIGWEKSRKAVASSFDAHHKQMVNDALEGHFDDAGALLLGLRETTADIQEWSAFDAARFELDDLGLGEVTTFCVDSVIGADDVVPTIERAVLTQWSDKTLGKDVRLSPKRRKDRDAVLREFRDLDRRLASHAVARVVESCNGRRPGNTNIGGAALIRREGMKKTRHRPIRMLMEEARDVIQALKPCFMMSPLTVSQYLDPDTRFDIVVFDEASQVLPADAINCIYRGTQVVIAGDQKQLPPTTFFQRMGDEDESAEFDDDELDQFESILDIAKGSGLVSLPLLWHYRSRHESLITYSNYSFYKGELVTYPGAIDRGQHVGIEMFKVDGVYRRGTSRDNPVEAEKVAERVLFHARSQPDLTVGVVAFSEAQASLIQEVVDQMRREHPDLDDYFTDDRLSGFFVKNLENVQGDERDIIIFSIGYGPDEHGVPVKGNFGPVSHPGGERRLNVAITRARQRVEVVSSIDASDFKPSWKSEGARHLKRYLDFAERGLPALALDLEDAEAEPESPFEESVLDVIRSWGFDVVPQVGTAGYRIDIGVRDPASPGRYAIGIECDGAMYHSSQVARDRDRLRQEVLENLGWTLYRIWGTSWYRSRAVEERLLREAIDASLEPGRSPRRRVTQPKVEVSVKEIDHDEAPGWVVPYVVKRPVVPTHLDMADGSARPALRGAIHDVVLVESPVLEDVVLSRVREAWGAGRAGRRMREAFNDQLRILVRNKEISKDRKRVLWRPDGKSTLAVRVPVQGESATDRKVQQVPVEELQLAIVQLLGDAINADEDGLTALVARLFGWARRGGEISLALDKAVAVLLKDKRVVRDGDELAVL